MNTICSEKLISVKKNEYIINFPWVIIKKKMMKRNDKSY